MLTEVLNNYAKMPGKFENNDDNNQATELYYLLQQIRAMLNSIKFEIKTDEQVIDIDKFDSYFFGYSKKLITLAKRPMEGPRTYSLLSESSKALEQELNEIKILRDKYLEKNQTNPNFSEKVAITNQRLIRFEEDLKIFKENVDKRISDYSTEHASNEISILESDFTFSNQIDAIGLDPYNLRSFEEQPEVSRAKLIEKLNPQLDKAGLENIPHIFHTIWLGSEWPALGVEETARIDEEKGAYTFNKLVNNVDSVKKTNPEAAHLFWTDRDVIPETMQKWCDERDIEIVQIHKIFPLIGDPLEKELYTLYLNEKSRQSYAAAADILRLMILRSIQGIYLDVDIALKMQLEKIAAKHGIRLNLGDVRYKNNFTDKGSCNNDIMMANGHGKQTLDSFCRKLLSNYKKTNLQIFCVDIPVDTTVIRYEQQFRDIPYYYLFKITPILTTGPGIIRAYYEHTKDRRQFEEHNVVSNAFYMENIQTWINKAANDNSDKTLAFNFDSRESAIKHIITYILHDLKREPRVLRLDYYKAPIEKYGIGDEILQILLANASTELKNVESITGLEDFCQAPNTKGAILNAVEKGVLTKLDLRPYKNYFREFNIIRLKESTNSNEITRIYQDNLVNILYLIEHHTYKLGRGRAGIEGYSHSAFHIKSIINEALANLEKEKFISHSRYSEIISLIDFTLIGKLEENKGVTIFGWSKRDQSTVDLYKDIRASFYPVLELKDLAILHKEKSYTHLGLDESKLGKKNI